MWSDIPLPYMRISVFAHDPTSQTKQAVVELRRNSPTKAYPGASSKTKTNQLLLHVMTSRFTRLFPPDAKAFRNYAVGFALWVPAIVFFVDHIASFHVVRGRSMNPTLSQDLIMVRRWGVTEGLRRGQVVLYR